MSPKMSGFSPLKVADLTEVEFISRDAARAGLAFYRAHVPGFERAWILDTASQIGTRHARRLVGAAVAPCYRPQLQPPSPTPTSVPSSTSPNKKSAAASKQSPSSSRPRPAVAGGSRPAPGPGTGSARAARTAPPGPGTGPCSTVATGCTVLVRPSKAASRESLRRPLDADLVVSTSKGHGRLLLPCPAAVGRIAVIDRRREGPAVRTGVQRLCRLILPKRRGHREVKA